ncbi:MAG TPA: ABC transporter permease [Azospirillaceae bacterium]|nr:ABC transporter permease [Azospirillaceae bacterium]
MSPLDALRTALDALRANLMRTILTMLGIVIGVGAVIAMVAVGEGAREQIIRQISSFGTNIILVGQGSVTRGGVRLGPGSAATLTEDDGLALEREVAGVQIAAPSMRGTVQAVAGNQNWSSSLSGITPAFLEARDWRVAVGRPITGKDIEGATRVVLLGQTVVNNIFGGGDPVGQEIRLNGVPFAVAGVLAVKGTSLEGRDMDDVMLAPLTTVKRSVPGLRQPSPRAVGLLTVKVRDSENTVVVQEEAKELLRLRHRLREGQDDDFWMHNVAEALEKRNESARSLTVLLATIAAVSLLVGGIGIMNIMLVSVTERTREIGLRLAIGARRRDILAQFLIEASTLSLIGGATGALTGAGVAVVIAELAGWPTLIRPDSVAAAVGISGLIGVFFGLYPAQQAARLNPIEALRHE